MERPAGPDTGEVALGYKLFLDPQLSEDGTISCNSCRQLGRSRVDNSTTFRLGVRGQDGGRNSPAVFNAALHNMQFWTGDRRMWAAGRNADAQSGGDGPSHREAFIVKRLKTVPDYPTLFKVAFPADKDPLNFANICEAIGAFERTLLTPSRFDDFLKGNTTALTPAETAGLSTFLEVFLGCTNCHTGTAVGGTMLQKFGVHQDFRQWTGSAASDEGRKQISGAEADARCCSQVPALNVTSTAPYFHDGRVAQLDPAIRIRPRCSWQQGTHRPQMLNDPKTFLKY
ncbi:MAG: cytochrome-c peroxidase [Flavobacteriales bacterium]|nr:cytochrome-c peroxidase [Flavobacteriales bacterium]